MLKRRLLLLIPLCLLVAPFPAHAATKVLTAEGTYTMGEGETMTFAESMALQKAKQAALEQAGTYVESYTKVQNYQLTADEIQTIAGGVLQVEVLGKTRTLVGDGLKFFVKIKATVTTDKVTELAQRVKGKNVAEEYRKLQEQYAQLAKDIEKWKGLLAKNPSGADRETALAKLREYETSIAQLQRQETILVQRMISGEAFLAKAQGQIAKKQEEGKALDRLYREILEHGHIVTIGEPDIETNLNDTTMVTFTIPVTVQDNPEMRTEIEQVSQRFGWSTNEVILPSYGPFFMFQPGTGQDVISEFQRKLLGYGLLITLTTISGNDWACYDGGKAEAILKNDKKLLQVLMQRYHYVPVGVAFQILPYVEYVGIVHRTTRLKLTMQIPLATTKGIRSIRAQFLSVMPYQGKAKPCTYVIEDRS